MLWISTWKETFRVDLYQPQDVCAVTWMMQKLDVNRTFNLFIYVLNVRLLSKIRHRKRGVLLTQICWLPMGTGCQMLSLDKAEKVHISLLSTFRFNSHFCLQSKMELITNSAKNSLSSLFGAVVRIETSLADML